MTVTKRYIAYVFVLLSLVFQKRMTPVQATTANFSVRLVNSQSSDSNLMEGRLEVYINGLWGTVCNVGFTDASARVACASLGFGYAGKVVNNRHGNGTGPIWLDNVVCVGIEHGIDKCPHNAWGSHNCSHTEDVSISCGYTEDYAVRLVNPKNPSRNPSEGRLEIYYSGVWGTVCDDGFNDKAARIVCMSLGYGFWRKHIGNSHYGAGTGQIWLDDVTCTGLEQNIDQCKHRPWGLHDCDHNEDVSVICGTAENFAIRLVNSLSQISNPREGRLEVYYSGSWGTVCGNGFTNASARVVCTTLGFQYLGSLIGKRHGYGLGQIWLKDVVCTGAEHSLVECKYSVSEVHNCTHYEDVSISCGLTARLVNSLYAARNPREGRLELYFNGVWETICSNAFTDENAMQICIALGFGGIGNIIGNRHDNGADVHNCDSYTTVSIRCGITQDFSLRLVNPFGNSSKEGRLEIYYSGIWGTVCEDGITDVSARLVCRILGNGGEGAVIGNRYGSGTDAIWLDNVKCSGTESGIEQCTHRGWGVHSCDHSKDVSISCEFSRAYTTRLSNSLASEGNTKEGRLEVNYNGTWGTVCDDGFTNARARLACASLGFGYVGKVINNRHGSGNGEVYLDGVLSFKIGKVVDKLILNRSISDNCSHSQDVAINCGGTEDYAVRLVNPKNPSRNPMEGRLEIYYAGVWGTVCQHGFTDAAVKVVCTSIGFGSIGAYTSNTHYGSGIGQIWLDDVTCTGLEQSIDQCEHRPWGSHDCNHNEDVSIKCGTGQNFAVRLVDSLSNMSNPNEGRLEIYYSGAWGTVCNDGFTNASAGVACALLGFGNVGEVIRNHHGDGTDVIWLDDLNCKGTESSIEQCTHREWGEHNCNHSKDVAISCDDSAIRFQLGFSTSFNVIDITTSAFIAGADMKVIIITALASLMGLGILLVATFLCRNAHKTRQEKDTEMRTRGSSGQLATDQTMAKTGETGYEGLRSSGIYEHYHELNANEYDVINEISESPYLEPQSDSFYDEIED